MKEKMKRVLHNKYILTTIFTIMLYILYLIMMKIYPFGEKSILKCDLYQQYINFFCYFRDVILNGKSIFVSWNLGLNNNFFTTYAYYLVSPLNLITICFKPSEMDMFVELITLIKFILISNSAVFYFSKLYNYNRNDVILFGLIYAYCSYVVCYSFHIMWLDVIYMLPITLYFVDKYVKGGKVYPITICLTYSILSNYYIGFILAFFTGIYYLAKYFIYYKISEKENIKKFIKKLILFLISIIISFGISMIFIVPSMNQVGDNISTNVKLIDIDFDKLRLFINVIFNNYVYMFTQKSSMMFSSTLIIALIPLYYLNRKIEKKEKVYFSAIIVFMLLPLISPFKNRVWHCFTIPNCFNYRYSFAIIFTIIIMAFREYQNIKATKKSHFLISLIIFTSLSIIEIAFKKLGYLESDGYSVSYKGIIISCVVYMAMLIILFGINYIKNNKTTRIFECLLLVIVLIDLLIGAKNGQNNNDKYFDRAVVKQYDSIMTKITDMIESRETERIVFIPDSYGSNMSMKYNYSNIGFFTSGRNRKTIKEMYKFGYNIQRDNELWITSYSGTFFNYYIAGVKYYITRDKLAAEEEIYGFEYIDECEGYNIYKNNNSFPIAYYMKENIEALDENPFEIQNNYINNLINSSNEDISFFEKIDSTDILNSKKEIIYNNEVNEYIIKYKVFAKEDTNLYVFSNNNLQVYINEEAKFKDYANIWSTETGVKPIIHLNKGESKEFQFTTKHNLEELYIYASNNKKIQNIIDNMGEKNKVENIEILSNGLNCTANFEDDGYLAFSISYDDGWKIYIDGDLVENKSIVGSFLGTKLEKGKHDIHIEFKPKGYDIGLKLTITGIFLLIIIIIYENRKNKIT